MASLARRPALAEGPVLGLEATGSLRRAVFLAQAKAWPVVADASPPLEGAAARLLAWRSSPLERARAGRYGPVGRGARGCSRAADSKEGSLGMLSQLPVSEPGAAAASIGEW